MQTIQALRRKIDNAQDLLSVVKTMKSLAAVNIRHYEQAVASLAEYNRTVELGLHALMRAPEGRQLTQHISSAPRWGAIVFGSDQGFCGQFNERIVAYAHDELTRMGVSGTSPRQRPPIAPIGLRCAVLLEDARYPLATLLDTPSGLGAVTALVQDLLVQIGEWQGHRGIDHVMVFHNRPTGGAIYQSVQVQLLPLNGEWLQSLKARPWSSGPHATADKSSGPHATANKSSGPHATANKSSGPHATANKASRSLPAYSMEWERLFSSLIRQYMFVVLYRAATESLAAEETARLASMQNAEKNIDERIEELTKRYHQQRGDAITAELMDIVAGFEAVMGGKR